MSFSSCLVVLVLTLLQKGVTSEVVFSYQENGLINQRTTEQYSQLNGSLNTMAEFTACVWVKTYYVRKGTPVWSYCFKLNPADTSNYSISCTDMKLEGDERIKFDVDDSEWTVDTNGAFITDKWNFICTTFKGGRPSVKYEIYLNGRSLVVGEPSTSALGDQIYPGGFMILGQDPDKDCGNSNITKADCLGFKKLQALSGAISGLNIWPRVLRSKEIQDMANCNGTAGGAALSWSEAKWNHFNMKIIRDVKGDVFCEKVLNYSRFIFPEKLTIAQANELCVDIGGELILPQNPSDNADTTALADRYYDVCDARSRAGKTVWVGIQNNIAGPKTSRGWKTMRDGEVKWKNWDAGAGGNDTNCGFILTRTGLGDEGKWGDDYCIDSNPLRLCTICRFKSARPLYTVRGLCKVSFFDRNYFMVDGPPDNSSKIGFKGKTNSLLTWNDLEARWEMRHLQFGSTFAYFYDDTKRQYPVGRKMWSVSDLDCLGTTMMVNMTLTLTRCTEDEFTCTDGNCLSIEKRCNLQQDCQDGSDEISCDHIQLEEGYNMLLPPTDSSNANTPLEVTINLDLIVEKIVMKDLLLGMFIYMRLDWKDRRITYQNLRENKYQNVLTEEEKNTVWIPQVDFDNSKTGVDKSSETNMLWITKNASSQLPFDASFPVLEARYSGVDNKMSVYKRYYAEFFCDFQLYFFPFDTQRCYIDFKMHSATKDLAILKDGIIKYIANPKMVEFTIINITLLTDRNPSLEQSQKRLVLLFQRDYFYYVTSSFLTSLILGLLSYCTLLIEFGDFSNRFMGCLTALLVLATLTSVYTSDLPKTSYFKVIDIWLQFFVITTAIIIAIHILVAHLARKEEIDAEERDIRKVYTDKRSLKRKPRRITAYRVNKLIIIAYPICFIAFTLFIGSYVYFQPNVDVEK